MPSMIAMSGGVDSSVAAALTADARGPDRCVGVAMRLYSMGENEVRTGRTCCAPDDLYDARRAAAAMGIRFYVYDAQERFRAQVIEPFVQDYARGETPNPCVRCNDHVKFDWLLDRARRLGATELVTGHYARVEFANGRHRLLRARDSSKDQSYFLHGLTQEELALARFPLGEMTKPQVRAVARERGLPNADKPESMEVCFVGDTRLSDFLESHGVPKARGEIVDLEGRVLGEHAGVHRFTVGQRRGIDVPHKLPLYVAALDAARQRVVVAPREEAARQIFAIGDQSWVQGAPSSELRCEVQVRHRGQALRCIVEGERVVLDEPAVGVAPGQSAVFYRGDEVLGGGRITAWSGFSFSL
jgi:tRNA-specific 2-thiouridylase